MIDEPWPIRGLALGAHKDTRELRHKHWQPKGLTLPALHGERVSSWGALTAGLGRFADSKDLIKEDGWMLKEQHGNSRGDVVPFQRGSGSSTPWLTSTRAPVRGLIRKTMTTGCCLHKHRRSGHLLSHTGPVLDRLTPLPLGWPSQGD